MNEAALWSLLDLLLNFVAVLACGLLVLLACAVLEAVAGVAWWCGIRVSRAIVAVWSWGWSQ